MLIFTGFDPRMFPVIRLLRGRIAATTCTCVRSPTTMAAIWWTCGACGPCRTREPGARTRLHLSSEGITRVAQRTCEVLGVPVRRGLAGAAAAGAPLTSPGASPARRAGPMRGATVAGHEWLAARREDARWARQYAAPWVRRRLGGTSSGDGLPPKRPDLLPVP